MINNLIKPYKKTINEDKQEKISNQEENNEENNENKKENISNQEENNEEIQNSDIPDNLEILNKLNIKDDENDNYKEYWSVTFLSNEKGINFPITCSGDEKFAVLLERFLILNSDFRDPCYYYICKRFLFKSKYHFKKCKNY